MKNMVLMYSTMEAKNKEPELDEVNRHGNCCDQCQMRPHYRWPRASIKCLGCGIWCKWCYEDYGEHYGKNNAETLCVSCCSIAIKWRFRKCPEKIDAAARSSDQDELLRIGWLYNQHQRGVPKDLADLDSECGECYRIALMYREHTLYEKWCGDPDTGNVMTILLNRKSKKMHLTITNEQKTVTKITMSERDFYSCVAHGHNVPEVRVLEMNGGYESNHCNSTSDNKSVVEEMSWFIGDTIEPHDSAAFFYDGHQG